MAKKNRIVKKSVNRVIIEGDNSYNKGKFFNDGNGVVTDMLNVTFEEVKRVYDALYGYQNYNGAKHDEYEQGLDEWWNTILSNARRQNVDSNFDKLSRPISRRYKSFRKRKY